MFGILDIKWYIMFMTKESKSELHDGNHTFIDYYFIQLLI